MRKQLLFIIIILTINCYSQISFEKGYYINNSNKKINCLIRNIDWVNNPVEFEYKLLESDKLKKETINSVKEFSINNTSKYVRKTIDIDRSTNNIHNLSNEKKPIFKQEELFLRVLIESKASLYEYVDGNLKRYFYNKENSNIEQLIFKTFKTHDNHIVKNNRFRQQLWVNLKCKNIKLNRLENVDYNKKELIHFFTEYNECHNNDFVNLASKVKKDLFNLTLRPRLSSSSLSISDSSLSSDETTDFESKRRFGFGLEAEFILPFNKNKWSILFEPTYNSFKAEESRDVRFVFNGNLTTEVDYKSVELPIGLRHYFFLNKNVVLFVNASVVFDFNLNSSIKLTRDDNPSLNSILELNTGANMAIGIGVKYYDKYSLEIRYQTSRNIIQSTPDWSSAYKKSSIIFGYSLF